MKNTLLKITAIFTLVVLMGACSTDEASVKNETAQDEAAPLAKGSFWDGPLGTVSPTGDIKFAVNKNLILADFEEILANEGGPADLTEVFIELKKNEVDPSDQTYVLIGSNSSGVSIGVMLNLVDNKNLYLENPGLGGGEGMTSTTCRGCATGCNLSFIRLQGKKVFYCNENGCGEFCTKNETSN
jgi:hypothetical protein